MLNNQYIAGSYSLLTSARMPTTHSEVPNYQGKIAHKQIVAFLVILLFYIMSLDICDKISCVVH